MTQFAICTVNSKEKLARNIELKPVSGCFYQPIVNQLFDKSAKDELFVPIYEGKDIDALCIGAQHDLHNGGCFQSTELFQLVNELKNQVVEFVFWYGNDFEDLEHLNDFPEFLKELEISVWEPACELYMHFTTVKKNV